MSLYNMMFGQNPAADVILATLGLTKGDVGRFRNVWVDKDDEGKTRIAVYTRNGGDNRDEYQGTFDALSEHPQYIEDRDDDFDCTYAMIYFRPPPALAAEFDAMASEKPIDPSEEWLKVIAAFEKASVA